jgi:hypothetical protein
MYALWVRGAKPRTVMSRIMRVRSSIMRHLPGVMNCKEVMVRRWSGVNQRRVEREEADLQNEERLIGVDVRSTASAV